MENSIIIKDVQKSFDRFTLGPIDMVVPKGTIMGLIGENGAGKTTLLKCILNSIHMNTGSIEILGKKYTDANVKEDIGVVLDNAFFAEILKVKDINSVMKQVYKKWDSALFLQYINNFKIPMNQTIKTLSKGMRKKLEIITALSHHPKLLLLDEPTSGLDPIVRSEILDIFLDFIENGENSILLSTHITSDLDHVADYITFISEGNLVFSKPKDELLDNYGIIKCSEKEFETLPKEDIVRYKKNKYNYEALTDNKARVRKTHKDLLIDKVNIEDIMLLYIKGVTK